MGRKSSAIATVFPRILFAGFLLLGACLPPLAAFAADLPLAAGSPLAGFTFDDRPLILPVQRNFQMAMLTASSNLGRSCGKMEAYGWRMGQGEQGRVNQIFNNTVDRLRGLGFVVEAQQPSSVANDITVFTADRSDQHFVFMWSAGAVGLVMVLCQSSPPLLPHAAPATTQPSVEVMPWANGPAESSIVGTRPEGKTHRMAADKFSPVGAWVGNYICAQGYTGGTLDIKRLSGDHFNGEFSFYPTARNPYVPRGSYTVYGEYDRDSHRILVNPGKWIHRPQNFYNTIMIGSFDPLAHTFSAFFQGITGCTSFEASPASSVHEAAVREHYHRKTTHHKAHRKAIRKEAKKKAPEKKIVHKPAPSPVPQVTMPAATSTPAVGIAMPPEHKAPAVPAKEMPAPAKAPVPAVAQPATPAPAPVSAPAPAKAPAATSTPAATPAPAPAPAPTAAPAAPSSPTIPAQPRGAAFEPPLPPPPTVSAAKAAAAPLATTSTPAAAVSPPPLPGTSSLPPTPPPSAPAH